MLSGTTGAFHSSEEIEQYVQLLFPKGRGYPLWNPSPSEWLPPAYREEGVHVGDVGILTADGQFDYLFNVCRAADDPINVGRVPEHFRRIEGVDINDIKYSRQQLRPGDFVASNGSYFCKKKLPQGSGTLIPEIPQEVGAGLSFTSSSSRCALLVLPEGAMSIDHQQPEKFSKYATDCATSWFKAYFSELVNRQVGEIFLITGCDKVRAWGMASLTNTPQNGDKFYVECVPEPHKKVGNRPRYKFQTLVHGALSSGAEEYQSGCVFLRGFRITIEGPWFAPRPRVESIVKWGTAEGFYQRRVAQSFMWPRALEPRRNDADENRKQKGKDSHRAVFQIFQQILLYNENSPVEYTTWMRSLLSSYGETLYQELADLIQSELDFASQSGFDSDAELLSKDTFERRCQRTLRYLSNNYHILPSSLIVQDIKKDGHRPVGGGGFADIFRGTVRDSPVCLKVLRLVVEPDEDVRRAIRKQFYNEAFIWKQLKHPNILPFMGVNVELFYPSFCLISPWMTNNNVISYLKQHPSHNRHRVLLEIAAGLNYLHSRTPPIAHGDIRGANILVTDDLRCCLADFGVALTTTDSQAWSKATASTTTMGAIRWMAPELLNTDGLILDEVFKKPSRDIFALGCTMLEILTLHLPFCEQKTDYLVVACLMAGKRPTRPENVPDLIWDLITNCWAQEPTDRPNAQEVYEVLKQL